MQKIGFSLQLNYEKPLCDMIPLLKDAGFSAVSPVWADSLDLASLSACVRNHGMVIQSLHAPHKNIQYMMAENNPLAERALSALLSTVDACAEFQIPVCVTHAWTGFTYDFSEDALDFSRFDRVVAHAKAKGVSVAFENLEGEEFLHAVMKRYAAEPHVGFCWDSGHDHCYKHEADFLCRYGDRLIMTHLNDNLGLRSPIGEQTGLDDLHFLPFDGAMDWEQEMRRLRTANKQEILNFEIKITSHSKAPEDTPYRALTLEEFIRKAGVSARKLANLYTKNQ